MAHRRITVGLDASEPARYALYWAVREAARRHASLLVVTAWPAADRAVARRAGRLFEERVLLNRMQRTRIAAALAGLDHRPVVARELLLAEPVTALCHAAGIADLVVLGSDAGPGSLAARVADRLGRSRSGPAPAVVVAGHRQRHDGAPAGNGGRAGEASGHPLGSTRPGPERPRDAISQTLPGSLCPPHGDRRGGPLPRGFRRSGPSPAAQGARPGGGQLRDAVG